MAITTPKAREINDNIISQLEATLNQSIPLLPRAFLRILAKALSGIFILIYKYAGYISLQQFVQTASIEPTTINGRTFSPLIQWGELVGVGRPTSATRAEMTIDITVEQPGSTIPAGELLFSPTNGYTYRLVTSVILSGVTVTGTVRAVSDQTNTSGRGAAGNLTPGSGIQFTRPQVGASTDAVVNTQTVTAANSEDADIYRRRVIERFAARPQGGAYADYRVWGEEAAGIIRVYPYTGDPGQVNVYSEATVASSGSADGIPTAAQLLDVFNLIEFDGSGIARRRNAGAFVNSLAITRIKFEVIVQGISGVADLAQVREDITAALAEYFTTVEPFIAGLSIPPRRDQLTRTRISATVEDVVTAANGTFTNATFNETGSPVPLAVYILGEGEKAGMDSVTFL